MPSRQARHGLIRSAGEEVKEMFAGTRIRHKLLFYYLLLYTLSLSIGFATVYVIVRKAIEKNIESELTNTTTSIYNLVQNSATVSIKNYLRGVAEKNVEILNSFYQDAAEGPDQRAGGQGEGGQGPAQSDHRPFRIYLLPEQQRHRRGPPPAPRARQRCLGIFLRQGPAGEEAGLSRVRLAEPR